MMTMVVMPESMMPPVFFMHSDQMAWLAKALV
jgi:hypothetical protein